MLNRLSLSFLRILGIRKTTNPSRKIVLSFAFIILSGALLLMLPVSSKAGSVTPFVTALFTATSATCVTGLVLVDTGAYYSTFGQIIILLLIQIGGLGFATILTIAFLASKKNIGMRNRMLVAQTLGLESSSGVVRTARHVLVATAFFELTGAVLLWIRFIPEYGIKGIWYGIFHSVSAFCNAGFDILGNGTSIAVYENDFLVMIVLALLVIIGGLGFAVWEEIYKKRSLKKLSVYSKLVLIITGILLVFGTIVFFVFEHKNVNTIGNDTLSTKWLSCFFQSVTCRTAGFDAMGQTSLTEQSKAFSVILMMIGGASGSTAGGIKVVSVGVLFIAAASVFRSRNDAVVMGRTISRTNINYATALVVMWAVLVISGALIICSVDSVNLLDSVFEVTSAYGTSGLSVGVSANSSLMTKIILMLYMFFGRVGVMTISVMFMTRVVSNNSLKYPEGNIMIG